jgi:uncharacterized glyoxalase superfamily protein PhnB
MEPAKRPVLRQVNLVIRDMEAMPAGAAGAVLGFELPDRESVDATFADLTGAGYVAQQAPYDLFLGVRYAVVQDPDGNAVGLMSPVDPDRIAPPPPPPA